MVYTGEHTCMLCNELLHGMAHVPSRELAVGLERALLKLTNTMTMIMAMVMKRLSRFGFKALRKIFKPKRKEFSRRLERNVQRLVSHIISAYFLTV